MSIYLIAAFLVAFAVALLASQGKLTRKPVERRRRFSWRGLLTENIGAIPYEQLSPDAQIALTEFNEAFMLALGQDDQDDWAAEMGFQIVSDAPRIRFPIPLSATAYKEFTGNIEYRKLSEKHIELIPKTWENGWSELAEIVEAPDFIGWAGEPERAARSVISLANELVAALLVSNGPSWETNAGTINFFQSTSTSSPSWSTGVHPYNVLNTTLGGFDNDFTGATLPSHTNLQIAKTRFRRILAANGKPLGMRLTHIIAPPAQEEIWHNLLEQDRIIQALPLSTTGGDDSGSTGFGAVDNRLKGTVKLIIADELGGSYTNPINGLTGSDAIWYAVSLMPGKYPWVSHRQATPEVIIKDKSSDFYKDTRRISMAHILKAQAGLGLTQAVQRWAGTSS